MELSNILHIIGEVDRNKKRFKTLAVQEFLVHGIQYVFP